MSSENDPIELFKTWYDEALSKKLEAADAMVLSTVSRDGRPSSRVVLFKGLKDGGIVFFTNYLSRKGLELAENPFASVLFYWAPLYRQVRIEGRIEPLSAEASDEYWRTRPRESQLSALASEQSRAIPSFSALVEKVDQTRERFRREEVPRPKHWGGYRLVPDQIEFWVGQENRLHHRTLYRKSTTGWAQELLSP